MGNDDQLVVVEKVRALRVARAHSLSNAARAEAEAWARNKERREVKQRVTWEWWRMAQSNHKAEIGLVDLGSGAVCP